jgi:L-cysteine S-thiosulfotransferase
MRAALIALSTLFAASAAAQGTAALDLFTQPEKGHCVACHQLPAGAGPETANDVGPRLEGARMRSLGREGIRDVINDPTRANPQSVMPPYGRHRLLDPREIETLAEFLHALP